MIHRPKQGEPIREKLQRIQHLRRFPWDYAFLCADEPFVQLRAVWSCIESHL